MPEVFWVAVTVLALVAIAFISLPLLRANLRKTAAVAAVAVLLTAAGLYVLLGKTPSEPMVLASGTPATATDSGRPTPEKKIGSVDSMVDGLAERLREDPNDGKSWLLLAQSYEHLNRIPEAIDAYERAKELGQINADLDALSSAEPSEVSGQIIGEVTLSESAKELVVPTDTVFIFARANEGPTMPLAVLRRSASELPIEFRLSDKHAMSADAKLSDAKQVVVTARVSRTGVATEALQNLEARSDVISVADKNRITLNIE